MSPLLPNDAAGGGANPAVPAPKAGVKRAVKPAPSMATRAASARLQSQASEPPAPVTKPNSEAAVGGKRAAENAPEGEPVKKVPRSNSYFAP